MVISVEPRLLCPRHRRHPALHRGRAGALRPARPGLCPPLAVRPPAAPGGRRLPCGCLVNLVLDGRFVGVTSYADLTAALPNCEREPDAAAAVPGPLPAGPPPRGPDQLQRAERQRPPTCSGCTTTRRSASATPCCATTSPTATPRRPTAWHAASASTASGARAIWPRCDAVRSRALPRRRPVAGRPGDLARAHRPAAPLGCRARPLRPGRRPTTRRPGATPPRRSAWRSSAMRGPTRAGRSGWSWCPAPSGSAHTSSSIWAAPIRRCRRPGWSITWSRRRQASRTPWRTRCRTWRSTWSWCCPPGPRRSPTSRMRRLAGGRRRRLPARQRQRRRRRAQPGRGVVAATTRSSLFAFFTSLRAVEYVRLCREQGAPGGPAGPRRHHGDPALRRRMSDAGPRAGRTCCYTSFTYSYLPRARILAQTLRRAHPDWAIHAVLVDEPPPGVDADAALADFDRVVAARRCSCQRFGPGCSSTTSSRPAPRSKARCWSSCWTPGFAKVVYLDPDIAVFHPLDSASSAGWTQPPSC